MHSCSSAHPSPLSPRTPKACASSTYSHTLAYFFQTNQFAEIRFVSVHAEDAFRDDDDPFIFRVVYFYQPFQLVVLVVPVPDAFGCRQTYTVY